MTRRMIDAGIWANEHFAMLPPMARLLQIGIINMADDQGRMKAHPAYLRSKVFPYDDVLVEDVQSWLDLIAANDTLMLYEVDGKAYLQLLNWWQYQSPAFASPSQYPRPTNWQDHIRYTGKSRIVYTCNWSTSSGDLLPDTCDQDGNPLPNGSQPHGQPHGQPPGQPHGQPGTPLIEDKDKDKDKDKKKVKRAPATQDATPPELSEHQELFGAICDAVGWDYKTLNSNSKGRVARAAGILAKADYTPADVREFMHTVWANDWRYKKNKSAPTIEQLQQEIGKLKNGANHNGTNRQDVEEVDDYDPEFAKRFAEHQARVREQRAAAEAGVSLQ